MKATDRKIVSLRGTSGSGKSTVVFDLMKRYPFKGVDLDAKGRPEGYSMALPNGEPLFIVGRYDTQCGGCDGVHPYEEIFKRIERYQAKGHVLFEGLIVSSSYGNIGRATEKWGNRVTFAFLDTPLDVCLVRVKSRRALKGNDKPLNPLNTATKHANVATHVDKIRDEFHRQTTWIRHTHAVKDVLALYGIKVTK